MPHEDREVLAEASVLRAKKFSLNSTVERTRDLYRSLL